QGWSLTRLYFDELTQLTTLDPVLRLGESHQAASEIFLQPGRAVASRGEVEICRSRRLQRHLERRLELGLLSRPRAGQPGPASGRSALYRPPEVDRKPTARAWLEGDWNVI